MQQTKYATELLSPTGDNATECVLFFIYMTIRMTVEEAKKHKFKVCNKYGASKTTYNGDVYDSKAEASYAQNLDLLMKAKSKADKVVSWERQLKYPIIVNDQKICDYYLDFKVTYADGRIEHVDVKGYKKGQAYAMFRLKKKLMLAVHSIDIIEAE